MKTPLRPHRGIADPPLNPEPGAAKAVPSFAEHDAAPLCGRLLDLFDHDQPVKEKRSAAEARQTGPRKQSELACQTPCTQHVDATKGSCGGALPQPTQMPTQFGEP